MKTIALLVLGAGCLPAAEWPIYLGAALIAAILETLYVTTGRIDYKTSSM